MQTPVDAGPRTVPEQPTEEREAIGGASRSASAGINATLRVLDLLAARGPLGLSDLARQLGLPKSTVHRIGAVLLDRGWAVRDSDGRYDLGIRALRLGSRSRDLPIVIAFQTVAAEFLAQHDESIALAVLDGDESLYLALAETSQPVRYITHVGSKTPAFASASGRVVLAGAQQDEVEALFGGRLLVTPTGRRLNGIPELRTILAEVRERGYAENWGETATDLYAGSVPIANGSGVTLAALTTLIPLSRVTPERREAILETLRAQGRRLSELTSWLPAYTSR